MTKHHSEYVGQARDLFIECQRDASASLMGNLLISEGSVTNTEMVG